MDSRTFREMRLAFIESSFSGFLNFIDAEVLSDLSARDFVSLLEGERGDQFAFLADLRAQWTRSSVEYLRYEANLRREVRNMAEELNIGSIEVEFLRSVGLIDPEGRFERLDSQEVEILIESLAETVHSMMDDGLDPEPDQDPELGR